MMKNMQSKMKELEEKVIEISTERLKPFSECAYGGRCAGGCRSYNFFTHGKMYESLFGAKNRS